MKTKRYFPAIGLSLSPEASHNFRLDFTASCLFSLFNVVFNQFYTPIAIQQGASNFQVGLLTATPAIGLLLSPLWTGLIDRKGPNNFVIYPNLIGRLLLFLPAIMGQPWVFVGTALAFQLLMGIQAPAYAGLMATIYPAAQRGRLMGYVRVIMGILMIPLAFAVGLWVDAAGPSGPLVVAGITGAASILLFLRLKELDPGSAHKPQKKRISFREQWRMVGRNRSLAFFFIATSLSGFGNILASPIYQIIQVDRLELSNFEIGSARAAYFTLLFITYFVVGWTVDRFSPKYTFVYGLVACTIIPLLYGIFGNYPSVIVASSLQGVADAVWDIGVLAFIFKIAPGRESGVYSQHLMLFGIRGTIAPILSTTLSHSVPLSSILFAASACGFVGTLCFLFGTREKKVQTPPALPIASS